jgi:ADP-ribose pyrophosphatase
VTSSDPPQPIRYKVAFTTPWFVIEESIPERADELPYYRMVEPDGVICLVLTTGGDILMIRQFRPNLGYRTLETPAGGMEAGETPEQAALREIAEETGYQAGSVHLLGPGRLRLDRNTRREYFVLALDAVPDPALTAEEGIELLVLPRARLREMVLADELEQIAALSFLGLVTAKLGVDLLSAPVDEIRARACAEMRREQ